MPVDNKNNNSAFVDADRLYGKKAQPVPVPEKQIGIDTDDNFFDSLIQAAMSSTLNMASLNTFNQVSRNRDQIYSLIDSMCEDSTMSAVLETYAEDSTEMNDSGRIVWVDSSDAEISKFITYLLDAIKVDKNIYDWTYSLCKYGDLYLRLYRESDYQADDLFDKDKSPDEDRRLTEEVHLSDPDIDEPEALNENVNIKAYKKDDHYVYYLEAQPNPAIMFELTKFGKTYAYIKTDTSAINRSSQNWTVEDSILSSYNYSFNRNDIEVYSATEFVHGCLGNSSGRTPEEVTISSPSADGKGSDLRYKVKKGQSLFYNDFKTWRELTLLQNSLLLNRLTKSSVVRAIAVEIGDMPKENIQPYLMNIKRLFEQSTAFSAGKSMSEYTNPGPIENNIYIPTRDGKGAINITTVGGDVNVSDIADVDYFRDSLFGGLRVPKQYFGFTGDSAGFDGGTSLSIISARYAKMIKRIQNVLIQTLTDAINLILIDRGLSGYINKFKLKMLPPTTTEEVARRESISSRLDIVRTLMDITRDAGVSDPATLLEMLKALLSEVLSDEEITAIVQKEIDKLKEEAEGNESSQGDEFETDSEVDNTSIDMGSDLGLTSPGGEEGEAAEEPATGGEEEAAEEEEEDVLPSPEELGVDLTDADNV